MKDTYFSTMALGEEARGLGDGEYLSGGNLFVRREILERLGGFDPVLGMQGNEIGTGEETRLQMTMRDVLDAPAIIYDPALRVEHLVRTDKMKAGWLVRHRFQSGRYNERIFSSAPGLLGGRLGAFILAGACLTRMVASVVFGILFRDRRSYPYFENYFFEKTVNHAQNLGRAWQRFRSPA